MNTEKESNPIQSLKSQEHCGYQEIWQQHYQKTMNHLLKMASTPGFKAQAWHRVKELENEIHGYYRGIQEEFLKKIKEINDLHRN